MKIIKIFNLILLILFIFIFYCEAKKRPPLEIEPEFRVDEISEQNAKKFELDKCAFYCFFVPLKDDVKIDLHFYKNISCSDIVYGFATVKDNELKLPTKMDIIRHSNYGNFKLITSLQLISTSPRVLLGMKMASNIHFLDLKRTELSIKVARRMIFYTRRYGFNGIFLKFENNILLSKGFELFIELLNNEIKKEKKRTGMRKLRLILSISSDWVRYAYKKMPKFDAYFDAFYLWADEINNELEYPYFAIPVDPLHNSDYVPLSASLARNAEHLAGSGVSRKKIIIGLSTWGRSYFIKNINESKMPLVENIYYSNNNDDEEEEENENNYIFNKFNEGKLEYQKICNLIDNKLKLNYENKSETTSLIINNDHWYSFNEPEHISFISKLDWISNHEFGGIGLYSIQGDDPLNNCTRGLLPLHRSVADRFKCRRGTKRGNLEQLGECTRLCFLNLQDSTNSFDFEQIKPGWCSHIIIGQASAHSFIYNGPNKGMKLALKMYNDWERDRKPYLIISFAGTAEHWKLSTFGTTRFILIDRIQHLLDEYNADGVELNCASGGLDNPISVNQMNNFINDLRRTLGWKKQILISIHPSNFIEYPNFDFTKLVRSVDYIIAIGYRYHRSLNTHTGHHSPLFKNSTLLNQPKMTIQGTLEELLFKKVPSNKIIISLSAEALSQYFVEDINGHRSWESRRIGEAAAQGFIRTRSHGAGVVSQTQVCTVMKEATTISHFLNELGVPYLVNNDKEFIAFDNSRSIQIKTVWLSLQNIAGIALHGLELDNIAGECPEGEPFHLLKTIAQSQTCNHCNFNKNKTNDKNTTKDNKNTMLSSLELTGDDDEEEDKDEEKMPLKTKDQTTQSCKFYNETNNIKFNVFCSISLANMDNNLLAKIPFKHCNVLIINNLAKLDNDGNTIDNIENTKEIIEKLELIINKNKKINLWGEIVCNMTQTQWEKIINDRKREKTVASLNNLMTSNNLSGLLLDCDNLMRPPLRRDFSQFLNELNSELFEKDTEKESGKNLIDELMDCIPRLALKIQLSRKNISEIYEPEQLNKLLKFILLPAGIALSKAKAKVLNPLYATGIANQENTDTQNGTVINLQDNKIKSSLIVLELPAFAILQKREDAKSEPVIVSQKEVCQFIRKPGVQHHTRYDAVTSYWKTSNEWLSGENDETIKYKVQFAMQRKLGGVMLRSLDDDDPNDVCKNGGFGLLNTINKARCGH